MWNLWRHRASARGQGDELFRLFRPPHIVMLLVAMTSVTAVAADQSLASPKNGEQVKVTVEKEFSGPLDSAYRLEVFESGQVVYTGIKQVKTVGRVSFNVSPDSVRHLVEELKQLGFLTLPDEFQSQFPQWSSLVVARITVWDQGIGKTVTFGAFAGGAEVYGRITQTIESRVPTYNLRCPFVLPRTSRAYGTDVCTWKEVGSPRTEGAPK
jgi:hypothetical protein